MSKHRKFREWYEDEERLDDDSKKYQRKDKKRYDKKKNAIQKARRQKARQKNSYLN